MSILKRLNVLREDQNLSKAAFEKRISKSNGYFNGLEKRDGIPGAEVILDVIKEFPDYNLNWIMTGEGEMLKAQYPSEKESHDKANAEDEKISLQDFQVDMKRDLAALAEGMTRNFEVVSNGLITSLQGQRKILDFIEKLNAEEISKATSKLDELLKQTK